MRIESLNTINMNQINSKNENIEKNDGFQKVLDTVLNMNNKQVEANNLMTDVLMGKTENTHGALIALEKASMQMELASKVRDELINGYKEIMRVQI